MNSSNFSVPRDDNGEAEQAMSNEEEEALREELHQALMQQTGENIDLETIQDLVQRGADVNLQEIHFGSTLLKNVTEAERIDVVTWLLEHTNVNVNGGDLYHGDTPLHIAAHRGYVPILRVLIQQGNANVNQANQVGETPLMAACVSGKFEAVQYLVEKGKAVVENNTPNVYDGGWKEVMKSQCGWTALHYACEPCTSENTPEIARYLVETAEASVNVTGTDDGETPLNLVCLGGHSWELVEWLVLEAGADPSLANRKGELPLHRVLRRYAPLSTIQCLVEHSDPSTFSQRRSFDGKMPLHIAAMNDRPGTVEYLLDQLRAQPNQGFSEALNAVDKSNQTPLDVALDQRQPDVVECLVVHGGKALCLDSIRQCTSFLPIEYAALNDLPKMVKYLVQNDPELLHANLPSGKTPLHCAASRLHVGIVKWLIQEGADANAIRINGLESPLHLVCNTVNTILDPSSAVAVFHALVRIGGANVNQQDVGGRTPLFLAMRKNALGAVRWLVQDGNADVNISDKDGTTPLMLAVRGNNEEGVEWLLRHAWGNQMLSTYNNDGLTARDLALQASNKDMAELFDEFVMKRWNLVQSWVANGWLTNTPNKQLNA